MELETVGDGIWLAEGGPWVWSPIRPTPDLLAAIDRLGR